MLLGLSWPLRMYLRYSPLPQRKRFLRESVLTPMLPQRPASFVTTLPGAGRLRLQYRETLGSFTMAYGGFERAEIEFVIKRVAPGSVVVDVGANVGIFTVPLAIAARAHGRVIAFEPISDNVIRLRENLEMNDLRDVEIHATALDSNAGEIELHLGDDLAYSSFSSSPKFSSGRTARVPCERLDDIWDQHGRDVITVIKIDVEGAEIRVLEGAREVLSDCRPLLLIEAGSPAHLERLKTWLRDFSYVHSHPRGFMEWNHLFEWRQA